MRRREPVSTLCRRFGIARSCAYKWLARYRQEGRAGLLDRCRRRREHDGRLRARWWERLARLRQRHPHWGAEKLRALLRRRHPRQRLPSARTLARWLRELGLVRARPRRTRRGPPEPRPPRRPVRRANDTWTIDFKGWFRTADGTRVEALTVRDLHSRYLLAVALLPNQSDAATRRALRAVFVRHGLPRAMRCDRGAPFGGSGPRGLTRLSAWWRQLGIAVEFGRRAHPEDNAGHEQMHAVYAREVAAEPGRDLAACRRRTRRWVEEFNHQRPHQALRGRTPAQCYRPSRRLWPGETLAVRPPRGAVSARVNAKGYLHWQGRQRFIGRAFARLKVALQPCAPGVWKVWLGRDLLGQLHQADPHESLRPVQLTTRKTQKLSSM